MEHLCTINCFRQEKDGTEDEVLSAGIVYDSGVCQEVGYGKLSLSMFNLQISVH